MEEKQVIYRIKELDALLTNQNCCIYGAGKVAMNVVKYASEIHAQLRGILVSSSIDNPKEIMGIPVREIASKKELKETLIVCVAECLYNEIENELLPYEGVAVYYLSDELSAKINYEIGDYEIDSFYRLKNIEKMINKSNSNLLKFQARPCLEYLIFNILDHCNLRCKGCDHFACIANDHFVSRNQVHQDIVRLSEIFGGDYINRIGVMGGEPLLHPELTEILVDIRNCFPYAEIRLTTNGLLLLKQDDFFWRVCRENKITIVNTRYPIQLDFEGMQKKAEEEQVNFHFFEGTGNHTVRRSFKKIVNLKGDSDPVESFAKCHISNYGNFVMEGKLYGCPFSCQSYRIFNQKFNQNLRMTENDYLDIYKINNMKEIFDFAARPKYYCRYCKGITHTFEWTRSKQDIREWIEE